MKTGFSLPFLTTLATFVGVSVAGPAAAQDPAACIAAASKAQKLRDAHELVEARAELRICAAVACPHAVESDCVGWLADVERLLPGVVVGAKDAAGGDLVDVKVSVDGRPFLTSLDGKAMPINAGLHQFHFEAANGVTLDRQVMVREGERSQPVTVMLPTQGATLGTPVAPLIAPAPTPQTSNEASSPWRTVGWIVGGVGVAGLVVGAISGVIAVKDKSDAHCTNDVCDPGTVSGIKSAALVSDIGWIAGGVLLAGGGALVLFGPRQSHERATTTGVVLVPIVAANGGEMVLGGSF